MAEAWTWGVDVSTKRVAIGCVYGEIGKVDAVECAGPKYDRLLIQQRAVVGLTKTMAERHPPVYVLVEQPSGKAQSPQLLYAVGATIAGVMEGLELVGAQPAVSTITVSEWKMEVGLGGNADKAKVAAFARNAYGWDGDQDEADALTIATAAWSRFVAQLRSVA